MGKKKYTAEQIITKLREAEVLSAKGETIQSTCRHLGITEQTFYRWRKEYGGIRIEQAKRLKDLEKENAELRKLVANLSIDNSILKETLKGNY
jgi:transposase-like protein